MSLWRFVWCQFVACVNFILRGMLKLSYNKCLANPKICWVLVVTSDGCDIDECLACTTIQVIPLSAGSRCSAECSRTSPRQRICSPLLLDRQETRWGNLENSSSTSVVLSRKYIFPDSSTLFRTGSLLGLSAWQTVPFKGQAHYPNLYKWCTHWPYPLFSISDLLVARIFNLGFGWWNCTQYSKC